MNDDPRGGDLPDLFTFQSGQPVKNADDWPRRRVELLDAILQIEYGPLPPVPTATVGHEVRRHALAGTCHIRYGISIGERDSLQFALDLFLPLGNGPFPVVLVGDARARDAADDITTDVLARGNILAAFNPTQIFPDNSQGAGGLAGLYPGSQFAALAAWAWGYHRCIDFLSTLPQVDSGRIAIVGHSRGGKAALLAAATDERIALAGANGSGCGGAGCFRVRGPQCETLADILKNFPHWFSPKLRPFIGKEASLPFDQHAVAAAVAPRALLLTEAMGDLWANPSGAWQTYAAARKAYQFLGAGEKIGIVYRDGGHDHSRQDWAALLDFMDVHFRGRPPARRFDVKGFPGDAVKGLPIGP